MVSLTSIEQLISIQIPTKIFLCKLLTRMKLNELVQNHLFQALCFYDAYDDAEEVDDGNMFLCSLICIIK